MFDRERLALRVEIGPSKSAHLTAARARRCCDVEKVSELRVSIIGDAENLVELVGTGRREFWFHQLWGSGVRSGVGGHPFPHDGLVKRASNYRMDLTNRRWREADFVGQGLVQQVEIGCADIVHGAVAQSRKNVDAEEAPVGPHSCGTEIVLDECEPI